MPRYITEVTGLQGELQFVVKALVHHFFTSVKYAQIYCQASLHVVSKETHAFMSYEEGQR